MDWYQRMTDSLKLFLMHLFLYGLLVELYLVSTVAQVYAGMEMPFFTLFVCGFFVFIIIGVWINVGISWKRLLGFEDEIVACSLLSEVPFFLLVLLGWILIIAEPLWTSMYDLILLMTIMVIMFPVVIQLARSHQKTLSHRQKK